MAGEHAGGRLEPDRPSWVLLGAAIGCAVVVGIALGLSTLMPGLGFWDTAEYQTVGPLWGTAHPTGFPAYILLGWLASIVLAPVGEPALRMNVLSAVLAGFGAGATVVLVTWLTGRLLLALAAAIVVVASPVIWSLASHADPHVLHVGMVAVVLAILVGWGARREAGRGDADRWLVAAAVAYGVAIGTHSLALLLAPGVALYILLVEPGIRHRTRFVATCGLALGATIGLLYLTLPVRALTGAPLVYGHPERIEGLLQLMVGAQFGRSVIGPLDNVGGKLIEVIRQLHAQLGILIVLVPAAFVAVIRTRPRYAALTVPGFLITCWFAASYDNADITRYYAGPTLLLVTWIAILVSVVLDRVRELAAPPDPGRVGDRSGPPRGMAGVVLLATILLAEVTLAAALLAPTLGDRDVRFAQVDQRADRRAQEWLDGLLPQLEPNALVLSWWSYSTPLWYAQLIQGERPDISIVDDRTRSDENLGSVRDVIDGSLGRRPVYLIRLPDEIADLSGAYELEPLTVGGGSVYRVIGRVGAAP